MPAHAPRNWPTRVALAVLLALAGCQNLDWFKKSVPPEDNEPKPRITAEQDPIYVGSIAEHTLVMGLSAEPLRGFGLVVGLNGTGSRDCPTPIRDYLIEQLSKQLTPQNAGDRRPRIAPGELIDSLDTAVVEVTGIVPAGACAGTRFDLRVQVIPGSSTQSLEGGLLLPTEMRYFDRAASGAGLIAGAVLAEGGGPLFVNPFTDAGGANDADAKKGEVLGGGKAVESRPVRLALIQPNYTLARAIERRINERFSQRLKPASALSKGYVVLETPPEYMLRPQAFRQLAVHLFLDDSPAPMERRLRELARLAQTDVADLDAISLAWEGVGRNAFASIQALYADKNPAVRFYAARAGLRNGDAAALAVVGDIATAAPHSLRLLAIRELGESASPQAALRLTPLLNDADQEIRIAAYEGLVQRGGAGVIRSTRFPHVLDPAQLNFSLDVVESSGPALIYVRRSRLPRIALFGSRVPLTPPVFYRHPGDSLTVLTVDGTDDIRLFTQRRDGRLSDDILVPPRVTDVITALAGLPVKDDAGHLRGVGLPYSRVVKILADLCRSDTITAALMLEQTTMTDLLGPELAPERPEAEPEREQLVEPARPDEGAPQPERSEASAEAGPARQ